MPTLLNQKPVTITFTLFIFIVGALFMSPEARAKAAYSSLDQMIVNSELIAVVDVKKLEKVEKKGTSFTFSQVATADINQIIKGSAPKQIAIYGGENFICASCRFEPGQVLVFLNHDREMLIGSNWHLSVRPIKTGQLDWFDGDNIHSLKPAKLADVLQQVKSKLPAPMKLTGDLATLHAAKSLDDSVVGEAPGSSKSWSAYKALLPKAAKHQSELQYIVATGQPGGRIYAAMLLHHAIKGSVPKTEPHSGPDAAKAALLTLTRCNGSVDYRSGCEIITAGIWDVAGKLYSDGKYFDIKLE